MARASRFNARALPLPEALQVELSHLTLARSLIQ